tara:strand:- start:1279 stop:1626 length:348 start_codon:yes stop_codon:yes gene_type:complete
MFSIEKRYISFLLLCIPLRIILAIIPLYLDKKYLQFYGMLISLVMINFFYLYFNNLRLNAPEGGGTTWWADFRLLHASLYMCAVIYALQRKRTAWVPLVIDVIVGLILFLHRHFY